MLLNILFIGFFILLLLPIFIFISLIIINYFGKITGKNYLKIIMRYLLDKLK